MKCPTCQAKMVSYLAELYYWCQQCGTRSNIGAKGNRQFHVPTQAKVYPTLRRIIDNLCENDPQVRAAIEREMKELAK